MSTVGPTAGDPSGITLSTVLRERGAFAVGQAARIGREVSGELANLHAAGAHHGAVTPDQIVIDGRGDAHLLRKTPGFGGDSAPVGPTATAYAAPEQLTEHAEGAPADLYALGVLLYEMVVGTPPIVNWDDSVVAERKVHDEPVAPSTAATLIPREYDQLTVQLMDPRPIARPSAVEAEAALRRMEVPLPEPVRTNTVVVEPLPLPVEDRRSIWPAVALAAVLGVIVALLIVWAVQDDGHEQKVVPTVVGQTQSAATATLRNEGFDVSASTAPNNGVAAGVVSEQSPLGGNKLKDKGTVAITVSSGPTVAPAPPIINVNPTVPSSTSTTSTSTSTTSTTTTTVTTPPPT